jgi:protein CpxP
MKRSMKVVATAALGLVTIVALAAWAPGGGFRRDPKRIHSFINFRVNEILDQVKASDAQKAKVNAVKDRLLQEGVALRAKSLGLREQVVTQLASDRPDARVLHGLVDQRIEEFRAFAHKAVDGILEVHQVFTSSQRAEILDELESMHR